MPEDDLPGRGAARLGFCGTDLERNPLFPDRCEPVVYTHTR